MKISDLYESKGVYTKRRKDDIYGLYANRMFRTGEAVLDIRNGDIQQERDARSIELDDGHYMHPDGMFANHSCDPSTHVDKDTGLLIAKQSIYPNDEITFNYLENESVISAPFNCKCGAENCVGVVEKADEEAELVAQYEAALQNAIDNGAPRPEWPLTNMTEKEYRVKKQEELAKWLAK